jgi:hypothetical protein
MASTWLYNSQPRTLVHLGQSTGTGFYASTGLGTLSVPYIGRLLEEPTVRRRIVDVFWGPVEVQEVTVRLANLDGLLTAEYSADLRGRALTIQRYNVTTGAIVTEWIGQIEQASLTGDGIIEIEGTNLDLAIFDQEIPRLTVETAVFPKALDVGKRIPVVFGNVPKVLLPYVQQDLIGGFYDYVIAGPVTFAGLWRNGPNDSLAAIQPSEYTVSDTSYGGLTTVRFFLQQVDFQGAPHRIYADVIGFQTERNFVRAVQRILSDTVWGLGKSVDVANFTAAATALDAATGGAGMLLCDGALLEAAKAKDVLRQLLMVRGMRLSMSSAGQWQITVDTTPGAPVMTIQDGMGPGERNLLGVGRRTRVPASDRPRVFTLGYRRDLISEDFLFRQSRTLDSAGREVTEEQDFVRDHGTADRVADYMGKRLYYGQQTVEDAEITPAARTLTEGQLVRFTYAPLGYTDEVLEVRALEKGLATIRATLAQYSSSIHTYTPGTLPTDNISGTFTDLTRTPPGAPSALSIPQSGTELGTDGGTAAWMLLQYTAPTANCTGVRVDVRKNSTETVYQHGYAVASNVGANQQTRLRGLVPGVHYDIHVVAVNGSGLVSAAATLLDQAAPGDLGPPTTPTGLGVAVSTNRTVFVAMDAPIDRDIKGYEAEVTTGANMTGTTVFRASLPIPAVGGGGWPTTLLALDTLATNTTYYLQIRAFDYSNNLSPWCASVPFVFAAPGPPTGVSLLSWQVERASDGKTTATATIGFTAPAANVTEIAIDYGREGDTSASGGVTNVQTLPSATGSTQVKGLTPGLYYNFGVRAVSALNVSSASVALGHQLAPGDTVAPSMPTSLQAHVANRAVEFLCIPAVEADLALIEWEIWTGAGSSGGGPAGGSKLVNGSSSPIRTSGQWVMFALTGGAFLAYGTTYYGRVRAVDFTGNVSNWTATVSFTYTTQDTPDITVDAVSVVSGAGLPTTASFVAAGLGTYIKLLELFVTCDGTEDILGFGNVTILNTEGVTRLVRIRVVNYAPTEHAGLPIESTCGAGEQVSFTAIAIDGAPGAGSNNVQLQVAMAGTATQTWAYGLLQATNLKR